MSCSTLKHSHQWYLSTTIPYSQGQGVSHFGNTSSVQCDINIKSVFYQYMNYCSGALPEHWQNTKKPLTRHWLNVNIGSDLEILSICDCIFSIVHCSVSICQYSVLKCPLVRELLVYFRFCEKKTKSCSSQLKYREWKDCLYFWRKL